MQPLVSVIIPMYNADKYIEKCIGSIQSQTYQHLDIVIVDDGSTDCSLYICERFAVSDSRIRIINKENGGVVSARKAGVEAAAGDFICWVDADDWIELDYVEKFVNLQKEFGADIVAVAHYHDIGENSILIKNGLPSGVYEPEELVCSMLYTGDFFEYGIGPHLYTKMFRVDILKVTQPAVPDRIMAGDDAAVVYPSLLKARKICVSDIAGYHYVQNSRSLTKIRCADEEIRVNSLIEFLRAVFENEKVIEQTRKQLYVYRNYMLALRNIKGFDREGAEKILLPFGGLEQESRVVIYGAGVMGQQIYSYLSEGGKISIVNWVDQNYNTYREKGLPVNEPDELKLIQDDFDCVIIANITGKTAKGIKQYLIKSGIPENKIRWFTKEFQGIV